MIYLIYSFLALLSFLVILNGFLRGAKKVQIDAFLGFLIVTFVINTFFFLGWQAGLGGIGVAFLTGLVTRPLAARTASKLFSMSRGDSGHFPGLPPKPLERISWELGRPFDSKQIMKSISQQGSNRSNAEEALLNYCYTLKNINPVMNEYGMSKNDLRELYFMLVMAGAGQWVCGHWVAASALSYPETLRYILEGKEKRDISETAYNLIRYFERGTPLSN